MKTYIAFTKQNEGFKMVAIEANNMSEAYVALKSKGYRLNKSGIQVSAVHIDFVSCEKVK